MKSYKKNLISLLGVLFLGLFSFSGKTWAQPVISQSSIDFGKQIVGGQSPAQTITLSTNAPLSVMDYSFFFSPGVDFKVDSQTSTCTSPGRLGQAWGSSCTIDLVFAPTSGGSKSGNLRIAYVDSNNQIHSLDVLLSGTGDQLIAYPFPGQQNPTLNPIVCGNGQKDPGEECDDGNTANNDGCDASCSLESAQSSQTQTPTQNPTQGPAANPDPDPEMKGGGGCSMGASVGGMGSILGYVLTFSFVGVLRRNRKA